MMLLDLDLLLGQLGLHRSRGRKRVQCGLEQGPWTM